MKKEIHPKYNTSAKVICACGNTFTTGSTLDEIKTDLCSACHPFFTGKQKLVDTARRVEKFEDKLKTSSKIAQIKKGKTAKRAARAKKQEDKKEVVVRLSDMKKEDKKKEPKLKIKAEKKKSEK